MHRSILPPERLLAIIDAQNQIAASALDFDAVMVLVVERAQAMTGADAAVVELAEGDEMVYHAGSGGGLEHVGLRLPIDSSLSGLCVRTGAVLYCEDATRDPRVNAEACRRVGAISMVCVPLRHGELTIGALKVYHGAAGAFDECDIETLGLLSGLIASHLAHANDFERQRHESRHDALTGLANWRAFDEALRAEIARGRRHGGRVAICLLDLDGFKQVNDTLGHAAGDRLLRAVGRRLARVRDEDSAFRLGGDEFALILVDADEPAAAIVAGRLAAEVEADPECGGVGISYGVAALAGEDDQASLLARADAAMYRDKARRRSAAGAR